MPDDARQIAPDSSRNARRPMTDPEQRETMPTGPSSSHGLAEALRFLLPVRRRRESVGTPRLDRAVFWIVPVGLVIGLVWVGAFRIAWRYFGETANLCVIPALTTVLLECLFTGPFLVLGLARTIDVLAWNDPLRAQQERRGVLSPVGTLALGLAVLSQWVLVVSIPDRLGWWPSESDWRHWFNFMYPRPLLRPLLLAPIWGRWGILLAATTGRTAPEADAETKALAGAMTPLRLLRQTILPLALTAVYFSREHNRLLGVIMGLLVFGVTYLAAVAAARRAGGQTRHSIFAVGQIAQFAFLAIYRAFWPLIYL